MLNLPARIVRLFDSNTSPGEVAAGVCLGMFLGFVPLNGPMVVVLIGCFFVFRINRLAVMLVLPIFKLLYVMGVYRLADTVGGFMLISADFMAGFWRIITHLPVLALLELNNTLVSGGLAISFILTVPVYFGAKKVIVVGREKYFSRIKGSKFVLWFKKMPLVNKILPLIGRLRRG